VHYRRPFDLVDIPDAHYVITADYVTTEDGTGLYIKRQLSARKTWPRAVSTTAGSQPVGTDGNS